MINKINDVIRLHCAVDIFTLPLRTNIFMQMCARASQRKYLLEYARVDNNFVVIYHICARPEKKMWVCFIDSLIQRGELHFQCVKIFAVFIINNLKKYFTRISCVRPFIKHARGRLSCAAAAAERIFKVWRKVRRAFGELSYFE